MEVELFHIQQGEIGLPAYMSPEGLGPKAKHSEIRAGEVHIFVGVC